MHCGPDMQIYLGIHASPGPLSLWPSDHPLWHRLLGVGGSMCSKMDLIFLSNLISLLNPDQCGGPCHPLLSVPGAHLTARLTSGVSAAQTRNRVRLQKGGEAGSSPLGPEPPLSPGSVLTPSPRLLGSLPSFSFWVARPGEGVSFWGPRLLSQT